MPGAQAHSIAARAGAVQFVCALAYGLFQVWRLPETTTSEYILVAAPPATATLVFMAVSFVLPSLFAPGRLALPLTLTLPTVYAALLLLSAVLWQMEDSALVRPPEPMHVLAVWTQPLSLLGILLIQVLALQVVGWIRRDKDR